MSFCTSYGNLEQTAAKKKIVLDCTVASSRDIWRYTETVFDVLRGPLMVLGPGLRVLSVNQSFCTTFQTTREEVEGRSIATAGGGMWEIPEFREMLEEILPQYGAVDDFPVEHRFGRAGRKKMVLNARELYVANRKKPFVMVSVEDVTKRIEAEERLRSVHRGLETRVRENSEGLKRALECLTKTTIEHKRAEDTLREYENHLKMLLGSLREDILVIGADYIIQEVVNDTLNTSGFHRDQLIGGPCFERLHGRTGPCGPQEETCLLSRVRETGEVFTGRHRHRCADGSFAWVEIRVSPVSDAQGTVTGVIEAVRESRGIQQTDP